MTLIDDVKRAVEHECRGLGPDDNALPTLLYRDADNHRMVLGLAYPAELADEMAMYMTASMLVDEAIEAFYSSFVWTVIETPDEHVRSPMPKDHPDRVEQAMIVHCTPDGGSLYFADITRSPDGSPVLGEWVPDDFIKCSGRIVRHMEAGIKMVAGLSDELRSVFRLARSEGDAARDGAIRGVLKAMSE